MSLYDDLGVSKTASDKEIKKAYRKKAMEVHPDRGGAEEAFKRVQHAYSVLSDPDDRAYYDRTGDDDRPDMEQESQALQAQLFRECLLQGDAQGDLVVQIVNILDNRILKEHDDLRNNQSALDTMRRDQGRIIRRRDDKKPNIFELVMNSRIAECEKQIGMMEHNVELLKQVREDMKLYRDTGRKEPQLRLGGFFADKSPFGTSSTTGGAGQWRKWNS